MQNHWAPPTADCCSFSDVEGSFKRHLERRGPDVLITLGRGNARVFPENAKLCKSLGSIIRSLISFNSLAHLREAYNKMWYGIFHSLSGSCSGHDHMKVSVYSNMFIGQLSKFWDMGHVHLPQNLSLKAPWINSHF